MSKHIPDSAQANASLTTTREASRKDHLPYEIRHLDDVAWEKIRWPGETGKMLFHPTPERPTEPNAGILRLEPGGYHPEHYHGFAQVWFILKGEFTIDGKLCKPGSMTPHTKFKGEVYILSKEEGGRHTPFFNGYRPQFYIRTTDVTGTLHLPEGVEMVMPGDNTTITGELMTPVAIEKGSLFAICEGGRTVGSGTITEVMA